MKGVRFSQEQAFPRHRAKAKLPHNCRVEVAIKVPRAGMGRLYVAVTHSDVSVGERDATTYVYSVLHNREWVAPLAIKTACFHNREAIFYRPEFVTDKCAVTG